MSMIHPRQAHALRHVTPLFAIAAVALFAAGPAQAGGWKGAQFEWQYYAYGSAYTGGGSPGNCTVQKAQTMCGAFFSYFNILTDVKSVTFDYSPSSPGSWNKSVLSLPPTIHNGVAINLTSPGTITAVRIDRATNMVGLNKNHISFTANQIQINWQKLSFDSSTIVKLDVTVEQGAKATAVRMTAPAPAASRNSRGQTLRDNPPRQ